MPAKKVLKTFLEGIKNAVSPFKIFSIPSSRPVICSTVTQKQPYAQKGFPQQRFFNA
jgi:hypothetical protein